MLRSVPVLARPGTAIFAGLLVWLNASAFAANERLASAPSAFLRAHAANPVQWVPWSAEVAQRAQAENKPVYLAIGFTTNELSQAMNRQTFGNAEVAAKLNEEFVCVLVDRDEHPALAALYQSYVSTKKQLTGWPLNVWLTPDLKPIDAATYLPPSEEWGKEGFLNVVQRVSTAWKTDAAGQKQKAEEAVPEIAAAEELTPATAFSPAEIAASLGVHEKLWLEQNDPANGGFGEPPRYVQPELLTFLSKRSGGGHDAALNTLKVVQGSPMRDPLDGGYFRYVTDPAWQMPYFQKLAPDQARIALAYLDLGHAEKSERWREAARSALDFLLRELRNPDGSFRQAVDTASEEARSALTWTREEIVAVLGEKNADDFMREHGALDAGNVSEANDAGGKLKGRNLLSAPAESSAKWKEAREKLLAARAKRLQARVDTNVIAANQGLILRALVRGHAVLGDPAYLEAAKRCASFVETTLLQAKTGKLKRLAGSEAPAWPADYAHLALGFGTLHRATGAALHRDIAVGLLEAAAAAFLDTNTGRFFVAPPGTSGLWHRPYAPVLAPGELPSAESTALLALAELGETKSEKLTALHDALVKGLRVELDEVNGPAPGGSLLAGQTLAGAVKQ